MNKKRLNNNKVVYSFTLVELMIVIVILAILGGVVYLILRPNKTINKAQDTQRVYDLRHITEYISTAELGKVVGIFNYGDPNIVYVSLPDTSATCASYTLPTLPPGYTYHCSTQENYKKPDGTGWIPIIFEGDLTGYSISSLPVDPVNQPPYYYTYFPSSSYELTALLSEPNSNSINDNGLGTQTFETGTPGISIHTPIIREPSLVGY